jgi:type IV pilus assembly protein PilE
MTNTTLLRSARARATGFTLIEIMVVLAIVGVLAAIAVPAYSKHVLRSNRSNAQAILMESAQFMERYYTVNNSYVGATAVSAVVPKGATGSAVKYNVSFSVDPTATVYTLQAVPNGGQTRDTCGTMTISHTGAQTPATAGCW